MERSLLARLQDDPRCDVVVDPVSSEGDLAKVASAAHVLVTRTINRVTRKVLESAPELMAVAQATSGIDNIDVGAARERGVAVLHLPGINANAVAELVIGFMLSLTRTVPLYTRQVRDGVWQREDCTTRHDLGHYSLGLVGLGHAGTAVARLARAFGMTVRAFDPYLAASDFAERHATRCASLDELVASSDIVSLHVPLTAETQRLVGGREIGMMRSGTLLINAARGEVLDADAALQALERNHLGGLALDVFDPEPPGRSFPGDPRLILTPHIAGCTYECRTDSGERLYARIAEFLWGTKPR